MNDQTPPPPLDREAPATGALTRLTERVRRLVAPNPSAFTFTGTCTYIVGEGEVAILDPGPDSDAHLTALLSAVRGERVAFIVVTHTHRDHSALSGRLKAATSAPIVGARPHVFHDDPSKSSHDADYAPDRILAEGESVRLPHVTLRAIETPGHASNHLCFAFPQEQALFSGDHVMGWSTSVVAPPDGSMRDYLASLEKLRGRDEEIFWPGHGGPVREPDRYLRALIGHRRHRETAILAHIDAGPATIPEIVRAAYPALDPKLVRAAGMSTLAHLEDLMERGAVAREGEGAAARYVRS